MCKTTGRGRFRKRKGRGVLVLQDLEIRVEKITLEKKQTVWFNCKLIEQPT